MCRQTDLYVVKIEKSPYNKVPTVSIIPGTPCIISMVWGCRKFIVERVPEMFYILCLLWIIMTTWSMLFIWQFGLAVWSLSRKPVIRIITIVSYHGPATYPEFSGDVYGQLVAYLRNQTSIPSRIIWFYLHRLSESHASFYTERKLYIFAQ